MVGRDRYDDDRDDRTVLDDRREREDDPTQQRTRHEDDRDDRSATRRRPTDRTRADVRRGRDDADGRDQGFRGPRRADGDVRGRHDDDDDRFRRGRDDRDDRDDRYGRGRDARDDGRQRRDAWDDRSVRGRRDDGDHDRYPDAARDGRRAREPRRDARDHRLVDAYAEVFATILTFRAASNPERPDYDTFRSDLAMVLDDARRRVEDEGLDAREYAFHAVVALADETAGTSDWDWADEWRRDPLQVHYFGNLLAGEQFFDRLDELRPGADEDLLEVYYVCLCAGFRGMFHDDPRTLDSRKRRLYQLLAPSDLRDEKYLTREAYGRHLERSLARTRVPLWWMAPFAFGAVGLYVAYYWVLRQQAAVLVELAR